MKRGGKTRPSHALVAQWIEHLVAVQGVAGSIPAECTITSHVQSP